MSIIRLSIAVVTKAQFDRITEKAAQKDTLPTVLSSKAITFRCKLNATDDQNIEGVEKQVLSIYEKVSRTKGSSAGLFDKTFSYLQREESVKFSAEPNNFLYLVLEKGPQQAATKKRAGPNSSPTTPKGTVTPAQAKRRRKEAAKAAKFASGSPAPPSSPNRVARRKEEFGSPKTEGLQSPKVPAAKSPEAKTSEEKTLEAKAKLPINNHTNSSDSAAERNGKPVNTKQEHESSAISAEPTAATSKSQADSKITNGSDDSDSESTSSDESTDESDSDDDSDESDDDETDDEKLRRRQRAERAKLLSASRRSSSTEPQELLSTQTVPSKPVAAKPAPKKPASPQIAPSRTALEIEDNPVETPGEDHVPGLGGFEKLSKFHPDVHDSKSRPAPKPLSVDAESSDAESEDSTDSSDSSEDDDSSSEDEKTAKSTPRKKKLKHLFN